MRKSESQKTMKDVHLKKNVYCLVFVILVPSGNRSAKVGSDKGEKRRKGSW